MKVDLKKMTHEIADNDNYFHDYVKGMPYSRALNLLDYIREVKVNLLQATDLNIQMKRLIQSCLHV